MFGCFLVGMVIWAMGQTLPGTRSFSTRDGLASNVVNTIVQDHQGFLWMGTNVGLTRFDGYRFVNFYREAEGHRRTENITGIVEDPTQHALLVCGSDYYIYTFSLDNYQFTPANSIQTKRYNELHAPKTAEPVVFRLSQERGVECRNNTRRHGSLCYVTLADGTEVWSTIDNGFYIYDPHRKDLRHFTATDGRTAVESDDMSGVLLDRSGAVWLTSYATGLYQLTLGEKGVRYHRLATQNANEQMGSVRSFSELPDGRVLITNMAGDVWCYDLANQHCELIQHWDYRVYATLTDPKGRLWTGLRNGGVWVDDRHLNTADGLTANIVLHLFRASDGTVWVSSLDGGLIATRERADGSFRFKTFLKDEKVHQVDADRQGRLWVATESGVFMGSSKGFQRVYEGTRCVGICCTGDGRVLVATIGQGLLIIRNQEQTFLTTDSGLTNDCVKAVCWDSRTGIVCATDGGITIIGAQNGRIQNIHSPKGIFADTYNESAALRLTDGRILLGSMDGFIELQRGVGTGIATDNLRPVITAVTVNDVPSYRQHFNEIHLSHNQNNLRFDFSCLSYKNLSSTIYIYWLEGADPDWRPSTAAPQALYNNLSPGHYRFHLRASLAGGEWSKETVCDIYIAQPWWWTWWMRLLYILLIALLFWYEWHQYQQRLSLRRQLDQRLAVLYDTEDQSTTSLDSDSPKELAAEAETKDGEETLYISLAYPSEKPITDKEDNEEKESTEDKAFLDKLDHIIRTNLQQQDLSMAFLSSEMCMSHSTLYRRIKKLTGMTVNEYVRKHRLAKSMQLLREGINVTEVSLQCGFSSPNYFSRCFKSEYGIPPSEIS